MTINIDSKWMSEALNEARKAAMLGEVPVGAIIVYRDQVVGKAHNKVELRNDATAHAEMLAIHEASKNLKNWRLSEAELYVTLEPCAMCMGAIRNSRIKRLVFGAWDRRGGACGSYCNLSGTKDGSPGIEVMSGVLEEECRQLLQDFFKERRSSERSGKIRLA